MRGQIPDNESRAVKAAILKYIDGLKDPKLRKRIHYAIILVQEREHRPLTLAEYGGLSKVTKHMQRITKLAEEALADARRKAN